LSHVMEIAAVTCTENAGDKFEEAVKDAIAVLTNDPDCHAASSYRCLERPDEFVLMVEWTSLQAHVAFRAKPEFGEYRAHIAHLFAAPPTFAHYVLTDA
jgi:quinol monooxygenase YgiN